MRALGRLAAGSVLLAAWACTCSAWAQDAPTLRARQAALREQLATSPFQRPLVIQSSQAGGALRGDIYSVVAHPYGRVAPALQRLDRWCDILMLHLNVKNCLPQGAGAEGTLSLAIGRKFDQPLADAYRVDFAWRVAASGPDYLDVRLSAEAGPLGTRDYRIALEAVPLDEGSSFVHLSYAHAYGVAARLAMQGYLATIGRDKVGFSITGRSADGSPVYVGGVRGMIERNAMRYYLAVEAYLDALPLPAAEQPERRLQDWIAAVERHPRQLHEIDRDPYLAMKRSELARQRTLAATGR